MIPTHYIIGQFNIRFDLFQRLRKRFYCNKYGLLGMLRCLLATRLLGLSERGLVHRLKQDRCLSRACGFRNGTPSQAWVSRFRKRITDLLPEIFYELVNKLVQLAVILGRDWSLDATHVTACSNKHKRRKADKDASWGYKNKQHKWFYGYKLHVVCDSNTELPIGFSITTGRVHDSKPAIELINNTYQYTKLLPGIVRADAAYNATKIRENIRHYQAVDHIPHRKQKIENAKRVSIERVFSRLKTNYQLNSLKLRGINNMLAHASLCLIAQLQTALTAVLNKQPENIRKAVIW